MEGRNRSGSHSDGVVKNRNSSGCLIIKKKPDAVVGAGSSKKEKKKRPRLTGSDSVSSDEELQEFYRRRGVSGPNRVDSSAPPLVYKRGVGNHGKFRGRMNDFDDVVYGRNDMRDGMNGNELDVYDFDEYDDLSDFDRLRMGHFYGRGIEHSELEMEEGSSKGDIIYKRRNSFGERTIREKTKGGSVPSIKRRFEVKKEPQFPRRKGKFQGSDEAIRLQGKSGVLKVMVKHKKENTVPRSLEKTSKTKFTRSSPYPERKRQKEPKLISSEDKVKYGKQIPVSVKSDEESDEELEGSEASPKEQSDNMEVRRSVKRGRDGGGVQSPERSQQKKSTVGKVKRGTGTEKQLLREKIKSMLMSAGWTIDYRPRRGRDYSDAVYVNPTGTAYWSIIKAYDALQKQLEEEGTSLRAGDDSSSFTPISENILSKLTRQTRKKIERELLRKNIEEIGSKRKSRSTQRNFEVDESDTNSSESDKHDDKLSSYIRRTGKHFKGASKKGNRNTKMLERSGKSIHGRKSKKIGRCTLLVRNSEMGPDSNNDGFVPYTGKRNLLSWLIDSGTVKLSEKVRYMNRRRTRVMLEGWITRDGIHCACCSKILTISKFEIHAANKLRHSFQNIYVSSGISLLQCQIDAWNMQIGNDNNGFHEVDVDGNDTNDDTCAICGDGGNLICCDSCPSTFHQHCLDIQLLPPGDWHCPHCSCKFCGLADENRSEENDRVKDTLLTCHLCEGKYHASCVEEMVGVPVKSSNPAPFCGRKCEELFEHLQKLLGVRHELEAGLCWSLIHRTDLNFDTSCPKYPQRVEWNSKLAVALTVMEECFLPIIDRRSGINMIQNVLYNCGSNFTRLNYSCFYTAILEKGDEIVSAACIRIRGNQVAEMPFIGTRHIYRHQGMCRRLFSAIEVALRSLKVEKLIIPAVSDLVNTWTKVFGFSILGDKDKLEMKTLNMLVFPGIDMLQKKLLDEDNLKRDSAGVDSLETGHSSQVVPDVCNTCDVDASREPCSAAAAVSSNDRSVTDFCSQEAVASVEETLHNSSENGSDEIKPPVISTEIKPVLSNEGIQGTTSSSLLDAQNNESAIEVKLHSSPDASADIHKINESNDPPAKFDNEVCVNPKLTQETSETDDIKGSPPPGTSVAVTSGVLVNGFLANGSVDKEHHLLSEASPGDAIVGNTSKPPADGNVPDAMEVEVSGAHEILVGATDVCPSSQTTELPLMSADGTECRPDFTGGDGDRSEGEMHHAQDIVDKPQHDSCDVGTSKGNLESEVHHMHGNSIEVASAETVGNISCEVSAADAGVVRVEKSQFTSCAGVGIQATTSEAKIPEHVDGVDVTSVQPQVEVSCEIPAKNNGAVEVGKFQLDFDGASSQPNVENNVHHAHDAEAQPVSTI